MIRAPLGAVAAVGPADMQPNAIDLVQGTETGPGPCHTELRPEGSLDATMPHCLRSMCSTRTYPTGRLPAYAISG